MKQKCNRESCFAYSKKKHANHCSALILTYEDDGQCPFFKTKREFNEGTKKYPLVKMK